MEWLYIVLAVLIVSGGSALFLLLKFIILPGFRAGMRINLSMTREGRRLLDKYGD
jgi:hypothetical protein